MIHDLEIKGYRGFSHFEMGKLGRVNLIVGMNNSGKSSVLEALYLLGKQGDVSAFTELAARRGEWIVGDEDDRTPEYEFDPRHFFNGHELAEGTSFSVKATNSKPSQNLECEVVFSEDVPSDGSQQELLPLERKASRQTDVVLHINRREPAKSAVFSLTRRGGLRRRPEPFRRSRENSATPLPSLFVSTGSLPGRDLLLMWDKIALTDAQQDVVRALRLIDSEIEAIAPLAGGRYSYRDDRSGFIVKIKGMPKPVPIGSLGDGIWRMLALAIALSQARDGLLLVDEIDTGLHHSVMTDLWRLIMKSAEDLNVQVFATTHSLDCINSLAEICSAEAGNERRISLQRIEAGRKRAVAINESEIRAVARQQLEVR